MPSTPFESKVLALIPMKMLPIELLAPLGAINNGMTVGTLPRKPFFLPTGDMLCRCELKYGRKKERKGDSYI
jgi:hypothetical protein